ncbi:hypothetical protein Hanom_Chr07g00599921 [Helianthus anomalus]
MYVCMCVLDKEEGHHERLWEDEDGGRPQGSGVPGPGLPWLAWGQTPHWTA